MKDLLANRVCVVTGAGKGFGRDIARLFYEQGAAVALISRTASDLDSLVQEAGFDPDRVLAFAGDVSIPESINEFAARTHEQFGHVDVLVNNAGIRFRKSFLDITLAEWEHVQRSNSTSTFLLCQQFGRSMIAQKYGRIINMASIIGTNGLPDLAGYGASKGAIIALTKCLATEWAPHNVNVNVIAPGFCETSYAAAFRKKEDLYQFTIDRTPQRRWGKSLDVANACLFLASGLSDFITGETLVVDGGWSAW